MRKVTLKGLALHKTRAVLTTLAVVIGVAMITGAYVVSDTMLAAAKSLSGSAYDNTDAVVLKKQAFTTGSDTVGTAVTINRSVLQKIRSNPQVAAASGDVTEQAKLIDDKGKVIGSGPYFAVGMDPVNGKNLTPFKLTQGRFATAPNDIVIDKGTADKEHWNLGDKVRVSAIGPLKTYNIVGITKWGSVDNFGTATAAVFTLPEAQAMFRKGDSYNSILVGARSGVSQAQLQATLKKQLGPGVTVESAKKQDRFTLNGLNSFVKILRGILLAFAAISIFVGAFIIFNTLSITVAQRIRELAMLRTVGASRRQVMRSVVGEAAVMGILGTIAGIAFGFAIAKGLQAVMTAAGLDLPKVGTVFAAHTAIVAAIVGIGVTIIASLAPALRATRIEPVAALREGAELPLTRAGRIMPKIAFGITIVGILATVYGNFGSSMTVGERLPLIGLGAFLLFIGVAMLSPKFVKPLASVLGKPGEKIGGASGVLARHNTVRKPGRTAGTAAAMMIGIALVTFVAVLAAAVRHSAEAGIRDQVSKSDYVISAHDNWSPVTKEAKQAIASAPGVSTVQGIREDNTKVGKSKIRVDGVNPDQIGKVFHWVWKPGSSDAAIARLNSGGAIVLSDYAKKHHLHIGSPLTLTSQSGKTVNVHVSAISDAKMNGLYMAEVTVGNATFAKAFHADGDRYVFVKGGSLPGLKQALTNYPDAKVSTVDKFVHDQMSWMNSMLAILYVMLAFAILVSLFGIVNTLALSVVERTREIGMLRAVGMTRRQTRGMVRHESIVTALIGATLGAAVGLFLGAMTVQALHGEGLTFQLPVATLVAFVVVAVVAGSIAAIVPARRAARLDVLNALQYV
jgi:putative ABC transport system permease protein